MKITLDISYEVNETELAEILEVVVNTLKSLEPQDIKSKELMDGSFRFETSHGPVYLTPFDDVE